MRTKKLIVAILTFIVVSMISVIFNTVEASSLGYLTITKERIVDGVIYKHQLYTNNISSTKNVWNLVTSNQDGTITDTISDIYCLRAGLGFTSESADNTVVQYSQSYDMTEKYSDLVKYFSGLDSETTIFDAENSSNFNSVMWILDNMLLEGATDSELNAYLKTYAGYTDSTLESIELKDTVLTRADIEAIQQLAIWYFTNSDDELYHNDTLPTLYLSISGGEYKTFGDIFNNIVLGSYGTQRQRYAETLYSSLISKAKDATTSGTYNPSRKITVYLAGTDAASEQPVVRIEEAEEEIDLALRKFITKRVTEEGEEIKLIGENSRDPFRRRYNKIKQNS